MYKNWIYLVYLIFVLAAAGNARAEIVGWWKFDEGTGSTAIDSSGNGHDGTLNGDSTWITGRLDGALRFDGDGDYVTCGHIDIDTAFTGGLTVCAWVNKPAGGDMKICSNRQVNSAAGGGFTCAIYNDRMEMDMCNDTARVLYRDNQGGILPGDTWMYLAWVYNDETDTYEEYRDGNLVATQAATTSIGISTAEFRIANDSPNNGHYFSGMIDDFRIYDSALDEFEILEAMAGLGPQATKAVAPVPKNGSTDVSRDILLFWTPGEYPMMTHNVYFSTNFDDVNESVALVSPGQDANSYNPGRLEFDQKYFWRIDEVNATDRAIYTGTIWNFTVESFVYPLPGENITATASSYTPGQGPENTINDSGLDPNDMHSTAIAAMWLTAAEATEPAWIQYEFDKVYKPDRMLVWNYNGQSFLAGFGIRDVTIDYSTDGATWTQLDTREFPKAPGTDDYSSDISVYFDGAPAKFVRMNPTSNWLPNFPQYGLSEVRFMYIPVNAREPNPDDAASGVDINVTLGWKAGREATEHKVYISADEQAVIDGTVAPVTATEAGYGPLSLDLGTTYYWRVDEVNNANAIPLWEGNTWSFITSEYLVVDDFESYNDIPQGEEGSNLVYLTWIDGYDNPSTNGSTMGYTSGASLETATVRSGHSAPLMYNNTTAGVSKVTANTNKLQSGSDWTIGGSPDELVIWVYGDADNNSSTDRMYAEVGGVKRIFGGDIALEEWQQFTIDLTSLGINLNNVGTLTIGLEKIGATGGSGMVFIDDIWLYAPQE